MQTSKSSTDTVGAASNTIVQINVSPLDQRIRINALFFRVIRIVKSLEVSIRLAFDYDDLKTSRNESSCDDGAESAQSDIPCCTNLVQARPVESGLAMNAVEDASYSLWTG